VGGKREGEERGGREERKRVKMLGKERKKQEKERKEKSQT
jgi:hypothetical protein